MFVVKNVEVRLHRRSLHDCTSHATVRAERVFVRDSLSHAEVTRQKTARAHSRL